LKIQKNPNKKFQLTLNDLPALVNRTGNDLRPSLVTHGIALEHFLHAIVVNFLVHLPRAIVVHALLGALAASVRKQLLRLALTVALGADLWRDQRRHIAAVLGMDEVSGPRLAVQRPRVASLVQLLGLFAVGRADEVRAVVAQEGVDAGEEFGEAIVDGSLGIVLALGDGLRDHLLPVTVGRHAVVEGTELGLVEAAVGDDLGGVEEAFRGTVDVLGLGLAELVAGRVAAIVAAIEGEGSG
jgi:hypothetical protein